MQILIFKAKTNKQFLKTLQILGTKVHGSVENPVNIGIFDDKLKVFHGYN